MTTPSLFQRLFTPKAAHAKWLLLFVLLALTALNYYGYLPQIKEVLNAKELSFKIGKLKLSPYIILRSVISVTVLVWMAGIVSDFATKRLHAMRSLKITTRTLISKILQILIYCACGLISLRVIGIDLTALAVFGGAVGIGLGFGLQKITSNFISGLILIMEQTLAIDDLIELGNGTTGFVKHLGARHTRIETPDGKEVLVPNEIITTPLTNLTYSNRRGMVEIRVGVSYRADLNLAHRLMLEAAEAHPRCIKDPEPKCFLNEFGDSAVIFLLQFWVEDVTEGRYPPKSDVMFSIWRKFADHGIELAVPQREVLMRTNTGIQ